MARERNSENTKGEIKQKRKITVWAQGGGKADHHAAFTSIN